MPDVNGWDVARAVKSGRQELPVLLLTGWADAVETGVGKGVEDYGPRDVPAQGTLSEDAVGGHADPGQETEKDPAQVEPKPFRLVDLGHEG